MAELVIIDDTDSLEEGEIADDTEVEILDEPKTKVKELPRRYTLSQNGNKSNSKHKKNCKHISPQQIERNDKTNPHTVNGTRKRHRSSCKHRIVGLGSFSGAQHSASNSPTFKFSSKNNKYGPFFPPNKNVLKNFTTPPKERKPSSHNYQEAKIVDNYPELLIEYKKVQSLQKSNVSKLDKGNCHDQRLRKTEKKQSPKRLKEDTSLSNGIIQKQSPSENKRKNEESEDEEELRKIALSTVTQKLPVQKSEDINSVVDANSTDNSSQPSFNLSEAIRVDCDNHSSDNYVVVDMEIDDDENVTENSDGLCNGDDLFIIDKNPAIPPKCQDSINDRLLQNGSSDNLSNTNDSSLDNEQHLTSNQSESNADFEEDLLRAELIASMHPVLPKPKAVPKSVTPDKDKPLECSEKPLHTLPKPPTLQNTSDSQSILNCTNKITKRTVKPKINVSKLPDTKKITLPPPRNITAGPKRLIITLNNDDTTSDESEEEEGDGKSLPQENAAVASIEALISDARQKSDNKVTPVDTSTVSCLSKLQQEEYNSLKRILAEKEPLQVPSPPPEKDVETVPKLNMQLSLKKIAVAKENLVKELETMNNVAKELQIKKQVYMTSKLKAQHLKEQLHAAEVVRASHLESWKKCSAKLDVLKELVLKRETIIKHLETQLTSQSS